MHKCLRPPRISAPEEKRNVSLGAEYLAVLETGNSTPYFLNLHNGEVAHTLILGMTGERQKLFLQFSIAERSEVPASHPHLRCRRQLPIAHYDLRPQLFECGP
jgi:hypothetical protein